MLGKFLPRHMPLPSSGPWKYSNLVEFCSGQEISSGVFLNFSTEFAKSAILKVTWTNFGGAPSFGDCWGAHLLSIVSRLGFGTRQRQQVFRKGVRRFVAKGHTEKKTMQREFTGNFREKQGSRCCRCNRWPNGEIFSVWMIAPQGKVQVLHYLDGLKSATSKEAHEFW